MSIKGKLWGIAICMFLVIGGMMTVTFVRTTSVVLGQMQATGAESVRRGAVSPSSPRRCASWRRTQRTPPPT